MTLLGIAAGVCATPTVSAETVALWLFDDPPGSRVAVDASGHGYHLTLGPDAAIVAGGKFGNALDADATDGDGLGAYRYRAEPALNPGDRSWTLECWARAKPTMRSDNRIWGLSGVNYIDYGRGDNLIGLNVASRFLPIDAVDGWNKPTGNIEADANYQHLAVVYDAAAKQLRHYFDGRLQFAVKGTWKSVVTGTPPHADVVFPPHYPMLQVGMRDAIQQWDYRELHAAKRHMKKFQGHLDEMRLSDEALYANDFVPPRSLARPFLRVRPAPLSFTVVKEQGPTAAQQLNVSSGRFSLDWSAKEDIPWLSLQPDSGTADGSGQRIEARVDASKLSSGSYMGVIRFEAGGATNGPVLIPVHVTVTSTSKVRDIGAHRQLFIDDRFIEHSENVTLRINQPEKVPVEFEAANEMPLYPCNVIHDHEAGVFRMYYSAFNGTRVNYAESTDGIRWTKPGPDRKQLGVLTGDGPSKTLAPLQFLSTVMRDPHDVPERRYKALEERRFPDAPNRNGVYALYSRDGLHFTEHGRVMPILSEGAPYAYWDARIGKYVAYMRVQNTRKGLQQIQGNQFFYRPGFSYDAPNGLVDAVAPETMFRPGYENLRSVGRIETNRLLDPWPMPANAPPTDYTTPRHVPMVLAADPWDGFADFYTGIVEMYPHGQDVYLLFLTPFRHFHPSRQPWFYRFDDANGPIDIQLAVSRDGIRWQRLDRRPYVAPGMTDEWDRWLMFMGRGMVRRGNYVYQYYWGTSRLHDSIYLRPEIEKVELTKTSASHLGALRQRLDGFVSADVDHKGGSITTPPIVFGGTRLLLNHNTAGMGTIFVELRDLNGLPIPGHSLADCEEITGNDVAWEVRWRGRSDLSALRGKPVKLHFRMANTRLYAFQFVEDGK